VARNVVKELRARRTPGIDKRADERAKARLEVGVDIPSREEIKALVASIKGRWRPLIITAIFTGMRASELRGLRWADVNFDKNEINVRQRADRYLKIGPPKSKSGARAIPMPPLVANTLREWKLACPTKGGLAFPNGQGNVESHPTYCSAGLCRHGELLASSILTARPNTPVCIAYGTSTRLGASTRGKTAA